MSDAIREAFEDLKILAMVRMNKDWAYVFNRPIRLSYKEETVDGGTYLIGRDGPIVSCLVYKKEGSLKAFAGRELALTMEDGATRTAKDFWWSCPPPGGDYASISVSDVESLRRCYVFTSAHCDRNALQEMVNEYEDRTGDNFWRLPNGGYRFPYWDYEKVIKHDGIVGGLRNEVTKLGNAKENAVQQAQTWAQEARTQKGIVEEIGKLVGCSNDWEMVKAVKAALQSQTAPAVPDGWVLVPIEPTQDMLARAVPAAVALVDQGPEKNEQARTQAEFHAGIRRREVAAHYRAMLAVAPVYSLSKDRDQK